MTRVNVNGTVPFTTLVNDPQYFPQLEQRLIESANISLIDIGAQPIPDAQVKMSTSGNKCLQYIWFVEFSTKDPKSESDAIVQLVTEISTATQQFAVEHPNAQVFNIKVDTYDKFYRHELVVGVAISWQFLKWWHEL